MKDYLFRSWSWPNSSKSCLKLKVDTELFLNQPIRFSKGPKACSWHTVQEEVLACPSQRQAKQEFYQSVTSELFVTGAAQFKSCLLCNEVVRTVQ